MKFAEICKNLGMADEAAEIRKIECVIARLLFNRELRPVDRESGIIDIVHSLAERLKQFEPESVLEIVGPEFFG